MPVLSQSDLAFWEDNGYVIVPKAVPQENLDAVIDLIHEFQGTSPDDPASWDRVPVGWGGDAIRSKGGMLEVYQHQALWNNRQYPRVHAAFAEILGTEKLWVSIDRANFNVPDPDYQGFIHWDWDSTERPIPLRVQGVLSLSDTSDDQGGFQCVPGIHKNLDAWASTQPADRDPRKPDLSNLTVKQIETKAGDLIIWHVALAHGNGQNRSDRPRMAQYITMFPARDDETERQERIRMWRERLQPQNHSAFPGDPRRWEEQNQPAVLTELGEKLLGLKSWEA
jgi:hypothetical protein